MYTHILLVNHPTKEPPCPGSSLNLKPVLQSFSSLRLSVTQGPSCFLGIIIPLGNQNKMNYGLKNQQKKRNKVNY